MLTAGQADCDGCGQDLGSGGDCGEVDTTWAFLHLKLTAAVQPRWLGLPSPVILPGKPDGFLMPAHRHQARWTVSEDEASPLAY